MARRTASTSAGSSMGRFACRDVTPSSEPSWYARLNSVNVSPRAVLTTTTRSSGAMVPAFTSFSSAANATAVWGRLYIPVASARAAVSASSSSVACSTTPFVARSIFTARSMLTGAPICIALAAVRAAAAAQYADSAAEVSPVLAQATARTLRPRRIISRTADTSTVIPRSLKNPVWEFPHCFTQRSRSPMERP